MKYIELRVNIPGDFFMELINSDLKEFPAFINVSSDTSDYRDSVLLISQEHLNGILQGYMFAARLRQGLKHQGND